MKNPASHSKMSEGYGAYTCDVEQGGFFGDGYLEIQVHPTDVRIDFHSSTGREFSFTFTNATIRALCCNLCDGGDCVGQLADAIEERSYGDRANQIAFYLRQCGELLAKWYEEEKAKLRKRLAYKMRDEAMKSLGLNKVRGNLGGTYWE